MADRVVVNEVGLRDGLQNERRSVSTADKLRLADALLAAGLKHLEVTSFVSPRAVPQMADAPELLAALPARAGVTWSALAPNEKGYERARAAGARAVAVVLSATETMNRRNINMSLADATAASAAVLRRARADGIAARAYVAVAFACPFEGPTPEAAVRELAAAMREAGAEEIAVADTIGAAAPRQARRLLEALAADHGADRLAAHFHDTLGLACANAFAALEAGVRRFDAAVGGLGGCPFAPGAAGNLATEDLVTMLEADGVSTGVDLDALEAAAALAEALVGRPLGGRSLVARRARAARAAAQGEAA